MSSTNSKKPILLVPMAGRGQRFVEQGYYLPKPLVIVDDKSIIDYSFSCIDINQYEPIFIVSRQHVNDYSIDTVLKKKFGEHIKIVVAEQQTRGTVCSCLLAKEYLDDRPVVIYTLDVYFENKFDVDKVDKSLDGLILGFKANSPNYSYFQQNSKGEITLTAEKTVISNHAAAGVYYFKRGYDFIYYGERMVTQNLVTNGEFYVSPLYNLLIQDGLKIGASFVDIMYVLGTPAELDFFKRVILPVFGRKPIALCADHSGIELKSKIADALKNLGCRTLDCGTFSDRDTDYNPYVREAVRLIQEGTCDFGIGSCRSGQGVNMAANKFKSIRSAYVHDPYTAEYARKHSCANFFSLPSKYVTDENLTDVLRRIMNTKYEGGRHSSRLMGLNENL